MRWSCGCTAEALMALWMYEYKTMLAVSPLHFHPEG
jgi:hypothetical protein